MRGSILAYSDNSGLISGSDGNRYSFASSDWRSPETPVPGMEVDFAAQGAQATQVFKVTAPSQQTKLVLALVCWFLGFLGVHRFMTGKTGSGIAMLLLSLTVVGFVVSAIWALVDFFVIVTGNFTDKDGNKVTA